MEEQSKSPATSVGMGVRQMAGRQPCGGEGSNRERMKMPKLPEKAGLGSGQNLKEKSDKGNKRKS